MDESIRHQIRCYLAARNQRVRGRIDGEKMRCEQCGVTNQLEWHHRQSWSQGGQDTPDNIQVLCRPCHQALHRQNRDFHRAGRWGGLVSAYLREQRLGRPRFCAEMRRLACRRWSRALYARTEDPS